jgi:hypothetical protein
MRKSILVVCVLVLAVCLWLLLHRRTEAPSSIASPEAAVAATNQNSAVAPRMVTTTPIPNSQATGAVAPNAPATNERNGILPTVKELLQTPIDFYGKVIDENSNPVSGVNIGFRWDDLTADDATRTTTATSDAEGLFSLHGKRGATLTVSVSKTGYYVSPKDADSFYFAFAPNNTVYSADSQNPVVFHLRKKGQGVELVTSNNGMQSNLAVLVPINGDAVRVDLLQQKAGGAGDLEISQIKPDRAHLQQATNWSFHMSIPAGGFIEEDDPFPFTAPETGYQTTVDLNFMKGEADWATQISKTYYIAFGQPQKYGWLRIEANIAQQTVFLTYAINPTGSQNLEPQ